MAADAAAQRRFLEQIRAEQVEILFRQMPVAQASNLLAATALAWFLWRIAAHGVVLAWWAAIACIVSLRVGLLIAYRRRRADGQVPWHTLTTATTVLSGIVWGSAGVLFYFPDSAPALIFLTVILAGMAAGTVASHSAWRPAQFSFVILALSPITLRFLGDKGDLWLLGLLNVLYLYNLLAFARQLSSMLAEAIRLRLEKQALVQQLRAEMSAAQQARARAEEANLAKSKFLAAASHDLRQPLHAMNLLIGALRDDRDPAHAAVVVAHLGAAAESLEGLLNELLDISRLEAGLFKPQIGVLAVQELFAALEQELRPVAEEKGIELCFVATRLHIESDPNMLGRILRNIITNAIRYTAQGAVLVGCRRKGSHVALSVCDTGPGIAPEHHQSIFREFYQLENPERDRRKGLGLGLAIVDGLCRILDHRLVLKSALGRGSTFQVLVPIASAAEPCSAEVQPQTAGDLHGTAVLAIDDEPAICQAMVELLECWGCRVLTAESAQEATARLAATGFSPDVVIADYRLREGRSGTEAVAEVRRALGRELPAAIVTGDTAPERLREASASGFVLLHKPVKPALLRAALLNWRKAGAAGH